MSPTSPVLIDTLRFDERRGTWAMWLFIASEAFLFVCLFFAYFYLGKGKPRWPMDPAPKLMLAFIMLGVLMASSVVLYWGELVLKEGREGAARLAVALTVLLGLGFLGIQAVEYHNHLKELKPTTDAYGSIFYTLTSFHAAHLLLGLLMLSYVLILPTLESATKSPHKALHNASLYWHFVDVVWVFIVALVYVLPNLHRG